jgi:hypothetical protein
MEIDNESCGRPCLIATNSALDHVLLFCGGTESIANAELETRYFDPPKSISEQGLLVRCQ